MTPEQLQDLNRRLSAYKDLHTVGPHLYSGNRIIATVHDRSLATEDLAILFTLAPRLLREYIRLATKAGEM